MAPNEQIAGSDHLRGILAMLIAQAAFVANESLIKLTAGSLPGGQAIFIRGLLTTAFALAIAWMTRALAVAVTRRDRPLLALRNIGEVGVTLLYLLALFNMPIANATAIIQFAPLATTAGAALFLGERVGWRRWLATTVGLIGLLIVIRPGTESFNAWSLVALAGVCFLTLRDLSTRQMSRGIPSIFLIVISGAVVTLASMVFAAFESWRTPSSHELASLSVAAVLLIAGYHFIIVAMREGEVAVVAPFRYSVVIWAMIAGYVVWHEIPDKWTLLGVAIITVAGVYTFVREQRRKVSSD